MAVTWTVTGQTETTGLDANNQYVPGMKVNFRTGSGATASVFVPWNQYTKERVQQIVGARAAAIEDVAGMGQGS